MEDAPTSLPPRAALSPPREPKEKRSKQTQARKRPAAEADAGADGAVVYSYELAPEHAPANSQAPKRAAKPKKDPVAESFLHTYSGSDSYQSRATGTRY